MLVSLAKGMGVGFSADALTLVYAQTAGHPYIARQLCSHTVARIKRSRPFTVDSRHLEEALPSFLRERSAIFEDVITRLQDDFPEEYLVLTELAKRPQTTHEIRKMGVDDPRVAMRHLLNYQLVSFDGGRYTIAIRAFQEWLEGTE
jgi:hypothetical protein